METIELGRIQVELVGIATDQVGWDDSVSREKLVSSL